MNTRKQIVEATAQLLQSKGLVHASTKEIARASGYSEGTLYKHFREKEDLLLAVIQEHAPDFAETVNEEQAGQGSLEGHFQDIALAALAYYQQILPLASSLFADNELIERHRQWMNEQNTGPQRVYERVKVYVEAEQQAGRIARSVDAWSLAALLLGPCFQYAFLHSFMGVQPFSLSDEQFVQVIVSTLMKGLPQP